MHYKDGQEAKLGDLVRGKPYNTPHEVVGAVVGLVPGASNCNLRVAFVEVAATEGLTVLQAHHMGTEGWRLWHGGGSGSGTEPNTLMRARGDYGETQAFELITRGL